MDFRDTREEAAFRAEVRAWLADHLKGEFAALGGRGGPADEEGWDVRVEWEKLLGKDRWLGLSWPEEYGGRAASFAEQVIFNEEYAKANAPARISFFGEGLFAPTLLAYGTDEQKRRFLPKIQSVEELWCQGYSEPNAGSDLANVQTRGVLDGDQWVVNGQKVWTTLAHRAQWCFCITRTDPGSSGHKGLSYLLIPMDQPGVEVRPLKQMTGTAEFNEVFFSDARTDKGNVLGDVNDGWKVAMATLGFERGTARSASVRCTCWEATGCSSRATPVGSIRSTSRTARSCSAGRRRSTRGRARSSATSSVSGCSGSRASPSSSQERVAAGRVSRPTTSDEWTGDDSELRVLGGAGPAPRRRAPLHGVEVAVERGPAPDGDDRGLRPRGVDPDGAGARAAEPAHPGSSRRPGLLVRGARHRARGDGARAALRAVLLHGLPRRRRDHERGHRCAAG